jgi:enamine deaminase RidA (YjgF/YER057c/UK114 family)
MAVEKRYIDPAGLFSTRGLGFTHVVTASPGTTVYISGQTAWNDERKLVGGDDLGLQAQEAFRNLRTALEAAGATPADVVFVRVYVVGYRPEHAAVLSPLLETFFEGGSPPASTWVGVSSLAVPGFLIEVEATAVVGARPA